MLRIIRHVSENVLCATLSEVCSTFSGPSFLRDGLDASRLKFFGLKMSVSLTYGMVIARVVSIAHELKILWPIITRLKIPVMNDSPLSIK
jgi:hypothetical protein